jgi:hypothetical protein
MIAWIVGKQQHESKIHSRHSLADLLILQSRGLQLQSAHLITIVNESRESKDGGGIGRAILFCLLLHWMSLQIVVRQPLLTGEGRPAYRALEFLLRFA